MRSTSLPRLALAALALSLTACLPHFTRVDPLEEALKDAQAPNPSGRTLALAGWRAWLVAGDVKAAEKLFERALVLSPSDPYALHARVQLALREGDPKAALTAALDELERAPGHPLASAAARVCFELGGNSISGDELLLSRGGQLLASGKLHGDAALMLRSTLGNIHSARADADESKALTELGAPTAGTLAGPVSPFHNLGLAESYGPETSGSLDGLDHGPYGAAARARPLVFADGRLSLAPEPMTGDVYFFAADFDLKAEGDFVVRTVTQMDHDLYLDGALLLGRHSWLRPSSTLQAAAVRLQPGTHRLMVKMAREQQQGFISMQVARLDGQSETFSFRPAAGKPSRWSTDAVKRLAPEGLYSTAGDLFEALDEDAGPTLAAFLAARDGLARDRDGAKRLLASLPASLDSPELRVLRSDEALGDRTLPAKVARGQATRDLEAALAKDPGQVHAWLMTAQLALDDGRNPEALEAVRRAVQARQPAAALPLDLRARVELALGVDAHERRQRAAGARGQPGRLRGAPAALRPRPPARRAAGRRRGALGRPPLPRRGGPRGRAPAQQGRRGGRGQALGLGARARREPDLGRLDAGRPLHLARPLRRRQGAAGAAGRHLAAQRPPLPPAGRPERVDGRRQGCARRAGARAAARRRRPRPAAAGGARPKTGKELLQDVLHLHRRRAQGLRRGAGRRGRRRRRSSSTPRRSEAYPDGSQVDRIHVIQKALDQSGVSEVAEVNVPAGAAGAQAAHPEGRRPHARAREHRRQGQRSACRASQVGDFVEYEYLLAHAVARPGPARLHRGDLLLPGGAAAEQLEHLLRAGAQGLPACGSTRTT